MKTQNEINYKANEIFQDLFKRTEKAVTNYRTDFDYDKKNIAENPSIPFVHITRKTGTTMYLFHTAEKFPKKGERVKYLFGTADREHLLKDVLSGLKHWFVTMPHIFVHYFDGEKLVKINQKKAIQLTENYTNSILNQWEQEEHQNKELIYN